MHDLRTQQKGNCLRLYKSGLAALHKPAKLQLYNKNVVSEQYNLFFFIMPLLLAAECPLVSVYLHSAFF